MPPRQVRRLRRRARLLLFPDFSREAMEILKKQGRDVRYEDIPGDGGHLDGVLGVTKIGGTLRKFLDE